MTEQRVPEGIDIEDVEKLASMQCPLEEMAWWFKIHPSIMRRLASENVHVRNAIEKGQAEGRISLRRIQWRQASGFGPAAVQMAIFLGKNWLGQTDKTELEVGGTIKLEAANKASDKFLQGINPALLSPEESIELAQICDRIDERGIVGLSNLERIRFMDLVGRARPDIIDGEATVVAELPPPIKEAA